MPKTNTGCAADGEDAAACAVDAVATRAAVMATVQVAPRKPRLAGDIKDAALAR
jgi:hypothetical protein